MEDTIPPNRIPFRMNHLIDSGADNPFYPIFSDFLERQTILNSQIAGIQQVKSKPEIEHGNAMYDENGILTSTEHQTSFTSIEFENYKETIYLLSIAQSIENFETYLKKAIRKILEIKFSSDLSIDDFAKTHRTNGDRIKFLKKYSTEVFKYFKIERVIAYYDTFVIAEKVRHITIHSDQVIKLVDKNICDLPKFEKYFKTVTSGDNLKITTDNANAVEVIDNLSSLALILYKGLSLEHSFNLKIHERHFL